MTVESLVQPASTRIVFYVADGIGGASAGEVASRLAAENVNITGGTLRDGHTEYLVRTLNEFVRPEDMRTIVIQRTGDAIVRLSDVARVYTGSKEREIITRIDGAEVPAAIDVTLDFGEDGRLGGSAGCNRYMTSFGITGRISAPARSISIRKYLYRRSLPPSRACR